MDIFFPDFESARIVPNALLKNYTTFQLGGACPYLIDCSLPSDVMRAVKACHEKKSPYILIGSGSNLLVSDGGTDRCIIRFQSTPEDISEAGGEIIVSGGVLLDDFVRWSIHRDISNFIPCAGIPGTVGGAIAGNAGAFGEQIGDTLLRVDVLDEKGIEYTIDHATMQFRYRGSRLQNSGEIVMRAYFEKKTGDAVSLLEQYQDSMALRREKHPDWKREPCAGSVFKNIEPTSRAERRIAAGFYLEKAGVKAMSVGGAAVYTNHANIVVKASDACTAADVYELTCQMQSAVREQFNLELEREIQLVGNW